MKSLRDLEKENLWVYGICPCTGGLVVADSKEEAEERVLELYNRDYSGMLTRDGFFVKKFSLEDYESSEYVVELEG